MAATAPDPTRRNERSRNAILRAAFELCAERSYDRTTIEAIAERAGVGKQTIYRWWDSKAAVMMEALYELMATAAKFPDTGDVIADLRQQMTTAIDRVFTGSEIAPVFTGLIAAAQSDPDVARKLVTTIIEPRVEAAKARLERAQQHGQIRDDVDLGLAVELLYGPLYHRLLLRTKPLTPEHVDAVLDVAFSGLRPAR